MRVSELFRRRTAVRQLGPIGTWLRHLHLRRDAHQQRRDPTLRLPRTEDGSQVEIWTRHDSRIGISGQRTLLEHERHFGTRQAALDKLRNLVEAKLAVAERALSEARCGFQRARQATREIEGRFRDAPELLTSVSRAARLTPYLFFALFVVVDFGLNWIFLGFVAPVDAFGPGTATAMQFVFAAGYTLAEAACAKRAFTAISRGWSPHVRALAARRGDEGKSKGAPGVAMPRTILQERVLAVALLGLLALLVAPAVVLRLLALDLLAAGAASSSGGLIGGATQTAIHIPVWALTAVSLAPLLVAGVLSFDASEVVRATYARLVKQQATAHRSLDEAEASFERLLAEIANVGVERNHLAERLGIDGHDTRLQIADAIEIAAQADPPLKGIWTRTRPSTISEPPAVALDEVAASGAWLQTLSDCRDRYLGDAAPFEEMLAGEEYQPPAEAVPSVNGQGPR